MKVYIDGENFRKSLARILIDSNTIQGARALDSYPVRDLLQDVLGADKNCGINYYSSKIKLPQGYTPAEHIIKHVEAIREYTRRWVPNLRKQRINYIKAGYLKVKSPKPCRKCGCEHEILQEKGVDVRLAVDMLEDAYSKKEKTIVVLSSDTDLCPALHKIKNKKARIIYVCFADSTNRAVSAVAHETVTISLEKAKKYAIRS